MPIERLAKETLGSDLEGSVKGSLDHLPLPLESHPILGTVGRLGARIKLDYCEKNGLISCRLAWQITVCITTLGT